MFEFSGQRDRDGGDRPAGHGSHEDDPGGRGRIQGGQEGGGVAVNDQGHHENTQRGGDVSLSVYSSSLL